VVRYDQLVSGNDELPRGFEYAVLLMLFAADVLPSISLDNIRQSRLDVPGGNTAID
jgi:hypothetical protein